MRTGSAGLACIIERIEAATNMLHNTLPWMLSIEAILHPTDIGYGVRFGSTLTI
ncbi:hypothetical protein [Novosphingobium sp. ST904]|uniref:hypothetical protein n=1 Tax=Novosphingobium sp. ST904 TaxID=1684385 RepID=UPI000A5FECC3|nr:hypothetical protein [Novosphingobium sp. ST904]